MKGAIDNRPKAHYRGDARGSEGTLGGPNGFGEYLVVDEVTYAPDADRSTVYWRTLTAKDLGR